MSLIFIEGFDHYSSVIDKWQRGGTFDNPTYVTGRFGEGQAMKRQFQNAQQSISRPIGAQTEVFFGCAFNPPGFPSSFTESQFRFNDAGGTARFSVAINPSGQISVSAGGFISTATSALPTSQYSYIEGRYIAKDAAGKGGVAEVKVDGVVVASIDGTLFATTTGADDDITSFGIMDDGGNAPRYLYDDLYILNADGAENNGYLGDVRVTTLQVKADGTLNDWTASDALLANFNMVDELNVIDDNTTHNASGLVGASEDYTHETFSDRGIIAGQVFGVQVTNATLRTDAGVISHKNEMVIAGTRFTDAQIITSGSTYFCDTYVEDTDPSDGQPWTEAKVGAVGAGITITFKET